MLGIYISSAGLVAACAGSCRATAAPRAGRTHVFTFVLVAACGHQPNNVFALAFGALCRIRGPDNQSFKFAVTAFAPVFVYWHDFLLFSYNFSIFLGCYTFSGSVSRTPERKMQRERVFHPAASGRRPFPWAFIRSQYNSSSSAVRKKMVKVSGRRDASSTGNIATRLEDGGGEQRKHDFVVSCEMKSFAALLGRPVDDIGNRSVVTDEVHVCGGKVRDLVA